MVCLSLLRSVECIEVPESTFIPQNKPGSGPVVVPRHFLAAVKVYAPRYSRLRRASVIEEKNLEIKSEVFLEPGLEHFVEIVLRKEEYRVVRVIPLQKLDFAALGKILTKTSTSDVNPLAPKKEVV